MRNTEQENCIRQGAESLTTKLPELTPLCYQLLPAPRSDPEHSQGWEQQPLGRGKSTKADKIPLPRHFTALEPAVRGAASWGRVC